MITDNTITLLLSIECVLFKETAKASVTKVKTQHCCSKERYLGCELYSAKKGICILLYLFEKAKADLSFFSFSSSILFGPKVAIAISAADKNPDNRISKKTIIISSYYRFHI